LWRLLLGERLPMVQVGKTALAATLAWGVMEVGFTHAVPFFAALAALLCVQPSVRQSLSRAVERTGGVIAGVLVAFTFGHLLGVNTWSVGLLLLASLLIAWLLRLGPQAAIQVPISSLLVVAVGAGTPGFVRDRVVDTAVGAAIGVTINALVAPPAYTQPVGTAVNVLVDALVVQLRGVAAHLDASDAAQHAPQWRGGNLGLIELVTAAQAALTRADESLHWNPVRRFRAAELEAQRHRLAALIRVSMQVRGVARTLHDHIVSGPEALSPAGRRRLAELVNGTADAVARVRDRVDLAPDEPPMAEAARGETFADPHGEAFAGAVGLLRLEARRDPGPLWTIYGALVEDLRRIRYEVREPSPAERGPVSGYGQSTAGGAV
jgi:uncharacterized membrane protein YccC